MQIDDLFFKGDVEVDEDGTRPLGKGSDACAIDLDHLASSLWPDIVRCFLQRSSEKTDKENLPRGQGLAALFPMLEGRMGELSTKSVEDLEAADAPDRWFLGLPLVGCRVLDLDEGRRIKLELHDARAKGLGFIVALALAPALLAVIALVWPGASDAPAWQFGAKALLGVAFVFVLLPVGLLSLRDALCRYRRLQGDLRQQEVLLFRGKPESFPRGIVPLQASKEAVQKAGFLELDKDAELSCEVLACSERVLSVNGRLVNDWMQGKVFAASRAPLDPYLVSLPRDYSVMRSKPGFIFMRRRLADNEVAELERHQLARREPSSTTIFLCIWLAIMLLGSSGDGTENLLQLPFAWLFFAIVFLHIFSYLMSLVLSSRFGQDLKRSWVLTVHKQSSEAEDKSFVPVAAEMELLPESQVVWTREGRPAFWRRV